VARIVQLTDLHLTKAPDGRTRGVDVWENLRNVLAQVRRDLGPVDLMVLTGDLANERRPETYARLRETVGEWIDRLRVVPGNHDHREMVRAAFGDRLLRGAGTLNFVEEVGAFRILGLDTLRPRRIHGRLGETQLRWLREELGRSSAPALLFMHHPPVSVGTWWLDRDLLRDHDALREIVRHTPVHAFFCGHVHQPCSGGFGGADVWTTPSTAYQFLPGSLLPASLRSAAPAFRVIDLEEGCVSTHVVDS
jgi:Icc protein